MKTIDPANLGQCQRCGEQAEDGKYFLRRWRNRLCKVCARNDGVDTDAELPCDEAFGPSHVGESRLFKEQYSRAFVDAMMGKKWSPR